jgi:cytochrome c5
MTLVSRRATLMVTAAAAVAVAGPALAATHLSSTSLNLRASKTVVKAHHSVTFTATLASKGKDVSGEAANIVVQERTAPTTGHKTTWQDQSTVTVSEVDSSGRYTFTVSPPIAVHKNAQKDQYRAVFTGDSTHAGSKSEVITITVKRASA